MKKFRHTLESIYLCIKYPFLYPRNVWNDKHWISWRLDKYLYGERGLWRPKEDKSIWGKAFVHVKDPNGKYDFQVIRKTISYPWAAWFWMVYFVAEWVLPIFHCIPTYSLLDSLEPGWRKAFGVQLCNELKTQLKKDHCLYKYRITQIKEKWGYLHWYDNGHSQAVRDVLSKYEDISWNTCIMCGKPATKITAGWISPYCDDCFPKDHLVYEEKMPDGTWQETEEYRKRMEELA